ncbi:spermatogenesis-associated protein 5 isoform X2 [Ceratina calcarata]|nr:spermatogenesis-associated protein 5 isoform X2 [Ceratina calcarata]
MSSKTKESGRKSLSLWVTCEKCQCLLTQTELTVHEANCPPDFEHWNHDFIYKSTLYGVVEACTSLEQPKNVPERTLDDMVFVSQSTLQLCEIAIADRVLVITRNGTVVKTAWPTKDKRLTSVGLTKHAIELNNVHGRVKVEKFHSSVNIAKEFIISSVGKRIRPSSELDVILKNHNENKIFTVNNKFSVPFYGKRLIYKISKVLPDESKTVDLPGQFEQMNITSQSHNTFYIALYNTKWTILDDEEEEEEEQKKVKYKLEDVGGYDKVIQDIKDVIKIALGLYPTLENLNNFFINKGILLYGPAGVGKSIIANALITECGVHFVTIYSSDVYSKTLGETEKKLQDIFAEAKAKAPSIVLIEEIDSLCPKRSNSSTDHERRVLSQLIALFDEIQNTNIKIAILATTSKLDLVDGSLRRPGRIDKEFEIFVPSPNMRAEILKKLLAKMPNSLSEENVTSIAFVTHGFVGADLYGLCSQAILNALKRNQTSSISTGCSSIVTYFDFERALTVSKPSAMKEVLIELPNVRWFDIGGQKDLKLKLKQAVEWPLRHPEAFSRMGINPPRGVLMFGPPGCSKTMIAKALATESRVNFLNVKGPELFSKWVGESEKAVREVFRKARQVSPSIVFIDEIDALGGERSSSSNGGSNVQERVLAQLLTELDGITALGSVTLVAATNRPDKIDKALLRPGRLDRIIYVPLPDYETRQEIFQIKLRNMPIVEDVQIQDLVDLTEGYSGAEIQAICHEAAMKALEEDLNATAITKEHFKAALAIITPRTPASLINLYNDYMNKVL